MAAMIGRPDAASVAQGAGAADNFFNATTGLFGLGYFVNFNKHFGVPCTQSGSCVQGGYDLGFQLHDVEDIGEDGPHYLINSYSLGVRILDSLMHIGLNLVGKSPDRNVERVVNGMEDAYRVLAKDYPNAGPFPWTAFEFIVSTVDEAGVAIVGMQLKKADGSSSSYGDVDLTHATLIDTGTYDGYTVNVWF